MGMMRYDIMCGGSRMVWKGVTPGGGRWTGPGDGFRRALVDPKIDLDVKRHRVAGTFEPEPDDVCGRMLGSQKPYLFATCVSGVFRCFGADG
jgi:hypothetical protein